jgi:hypothetical protein
MFGLAHAPYFCQNKLWQNPAHIFFAWIFAKFGPEVNGYFFAKLRNIGKIPPTLFVLEHIIII